MRHPRNPHRAASRLELPQQRDGHQGHLNRCGVALPGSRQRHAGFLTQLGAKLRAIVPQRGLVSIEAVTQSQRGASGHGILGRGGQSVGFGALPLGHEAHDLFATSAELGFCRCDACRAGRAILAGNNNCGKFGNCST